MTGETDPTRALAQRLWLRVERDLSTLVRASLLDELHREARERALMAGMEPPPGSAERLGLDTRILDLALARDGGVARLRALVAVLRGYAALEAAWNSEGEVDEPELDLAVANADRALAEWSGRARDGTRLA